jgi:hypothetical protein|tara:strand:- start:182 stop:424 length:243 start_codon:yes stop_codon:yes gene_type:complete
MATSIDTNSTTWTLIGTGKTTAIIQISGLDAAIYIGSSTPAANAVGYSIAPGVPVSVPNLADLGGGLWAKGAGGAVYDAV